MIMLDNVTKMSGGFLMIQSTGTLRMSYPRFLQYILPSILSMMALSFFTTVDGFFVSRFVGPDPLAAINIVIPFCCLVYAIALMLATGAGAYVSIKMGEGDLEEARHLFSYILTLLCLIGAVVTAVSLILLKPIMIFLGSTEMLLPYTMVYGGVTVAITVPMMMKLFFEFFARVDGNPKLSFWMSAVGLALNVIFDYLLVGPCQLGILGAALGTGISIAASALMGLIHFFSPRAQLRFCRPQRRSGFLLRSCVNGSSQFLTEISTGVVTYLFNIQILKFRGELGISAVTIITFMYYFYISVYMGLSSGASPLVSYGAGAGDREGSRRITRFCYVSLVWMSLLIFLISLTCGHAVNRIFSDDAALLAIADHGNRLFSSCYLFAGVNVLTAALLTALDRGKPAAAISTLRCLIFPSAAMMLLPLALGEAGVWLAIPAGELFTVAASAYYYFRTLSPALQAI